MATANCNEQRRLYEDATIRRALGFLQNRLREPGAALDAPQAVRDYLALALGEREHEIFMVLFLDSQNRVIAAEELFRGTLTQTSVYPREVAKRALALNAAAVILAHNHPSGIPEPSQADHWLTDRLISALALVDVRALDHFVIGGRDVVSFAERGWMGGQPAPRAVPAKVMTKPSNKQAAKRGRPRKVKAEPNAAGV